ncbi:hypothetical protein MtrunA17_Chr4g0015111 [Medicago truncatula]|uniref:Uncharacterized protein n=1 Tax=Medicago truncatula TaxID=3880 RepID=A0A072UIS1_MEDTR|nr:hypothetical protein MTR_4g033445 [Medicago truncatula]RHN59603.1 hypothetical protein MtrunA17_Chr4g0015111 [Medicago truncatula]
MPLILTSLNLNTSLYLKSDLISASHPQPHPRFNQVQHHTTTPLHQKSCLLTAASGGASNNF